MPSPAPSRPFLARIVVVFAVFAALGATLVGGERRAHLFIGLSTNETQAARLLETAESVQQSLLRRGFDPASVLLHAPEPGRPLRREDILAALAPSPTAAAADETWIVLLGTAAPDRRGQAAFQVTGPRLTAADLATALGALPGQKSVVVATSASGGFLPPLLALPDIAAVAATADSGQISEPRFAAFWADALAADPHAPFATLAARAAERVEAFYDESSLAQGETARLLDRASGRILEAPFTARNSPAPEARPPVAPGPPSPIDIAALQIPKATGETEIEQRPADDESRALLAAARAAAAGSDHAAIILRTEAELLVASDFSRRETWRRRAYLRTGEALDELGTLHLGANSAFATARLVTARVIRPDASQLVVNPAARSARLAAQIEADRARDRESGSDGPPAPSGFESPSTIHLPEVTADCLVETEWTLEFRPTGELPEFYHEWHLATAFPQKELSLKITRPAAPRWRAFAPNLPIIPHTRWTTFGWELADIPAHEPLPHDLPARARLPWLGLSSVATWDDFAAWYRRLAAGSDEAGPDVQSLASEIAAAHPDRVSRLRAAYERVAALRYVAIELGVGAFRPRSPEQVWRQRHGDCKDKANLLVALLAKLGIPAEFALVNRFDTTFTDFPGWQFNHALARVPAAPEAGQPHDLWLDTTDRLVPFGVVSPGDLGRQALVFSPGFAAAAFHEITAAQEPPATWTETFSAPVDGLHRIQITATGSAELALRRLLLGLAPAQRRAALSDWLGAPVSALEAPDAFDLARPFVLSFNTPVSPPARLRPLVPGLSAYLQASDRPRLWNEGRPWTFTRVTPAGTETRPVPARLP